MSLQSVSIQNPAVTESRSEKYQDPQRLFCKCFRKRDVVDDPFALPFITFNEINDFTRTSQARWTSEIANPRRSKYLSFTYVYLSDEPISVPFLPSLFIAS